MPMAQRLDLDSLQVADDALWQQGPPHEVFRELRERCPVHWSEGIAQSPQDEGFWSVTTAEHITEVSKDWQTYSSAQNIIITDYGVPLELVQGMFIGMDPPKHDRIKALFQRAFTPKAIARHEPEIRQIAQDVFARLDGHGTCDLVIELAQPDRGRPRRVVLGVQAHEGADDAGDDHPSSNRDAERYENPDRFDVTRNPEHQAFGAGGRHFCGTALARLELRILVEETVSRFPRAAEPSYVVSQFSSQLKTLPVILNP